MYSGQARLVDLHEEKVITGEIADLDAKQRQVVMREMSTSKPWLHGYATEAVRLLRNQLLAVQHEEPLKLLYIASGQTEARRAADAINEITGQDFSRLVVSEEPGALRTLHAAAAERHPCAIVAVRMVTEGFDCPQVSTIAYASNVTAPLSIAQTMARAMRITATERANGRMLTAQILIPDHPELRRVFASALAGAVHTVEETEDDQSCRRCGLPSGQCRCVWEGQRLQRYELLDLSDPLLDSANVLGHEDGEVPAAELNQVIPILRDLQIDETYAPRFVVAARRYRPPLRTYTIQEEPTATAPSVTEVNDPRTINRIHRAKLKQAAGWMEKHIGHDSRFETVKHFQWQANQAAGIPSGGRDHASSAQLMACADWMCARIVEHCQAQEEQAPSWARRTDA